MTGRGLSQRPSFCGTLDTERRQETRTLLDGSDANGRLVVRLEGTPSRVVGTKTPSGCGPANGNDTMAQTLQRADRVSLAAIDKYLRSCFARAAEPRVSELARRLAVSRGTLISAMKKLSGITPAKYFRQRQVERAQEFLLRGWPIEGAARQAGFGTRRAFFRSFRAQTGMTPNTYRIEQSVPRQPRGRSDGVRAKATNH